MEILFLNSSESPEGVREEDYFPFVFGYGRDGGHIYSICPYVNMFGYRMDEGVLGGGEEPDMEVLADALLSWEGGGAFLAGKSSRELLEIFLGGSETLWGMVDWEKGSCDFGGGLFEKILRAAGRYEDDGRKGQLPGAAEYRTFDNIFMFDSAAEQERDGKVTCGGLFDDGCHAVAESLMAMGVNSNSPNKEGAWEFLRFLLGDEVQTPDVVGRPVSRKGLELWLEEQRARVADGKTVTWDMPKVLPNKKLTYIQVTYTEEDLTEEKLEEYRKEWEGAKFYPIRTAVILDIIYEESEDYFNGIKNEAQVCEAVENRVQLYLDEIR